MLKMPPRELALASAQSAARPLLPGAGADVEASMLDAVSHGSGLATPDRRDASDSLARPHDPAADPGPELRALFNPFSTAAEQFRSLRCQLSLRMGAPVAGHGQVVAVVGSARGEGRSFIAANLAVSMAQRGGRVLLVDADLRRPRLHRLFGLRAADGLALMLDGRADYRSVRPVAQVPGLHLLPAGAPPAHPLELVERPEFALVMRQLRLRFSHIVVDTPAAADGPDAAVVAANCDAGLLVVQRHHSKMDALQRLLDAMRLAGTPLAGAVLNER
jgi:capsular exopolysaccharide synthesis family protein